MNPRWTAEELNILKEKYLSVATCEEFQEKYLPNRSLISIYKKSKKLGIHRTGLWETMNLFENVTREEICYLAGIVDGEGYIKANTKKGIVIQVTNTHKPLIDWMVKHFGGTVGEREPLKPNHNKCWIWTMSRIERVIRLLQLLYPYLIVKKAKTDLVFKHFNIKGGDYE